MYSHDESHYSNDFRSQDPCASIARGGCTRMRAHCSIMNGRPVTDAEARSWSCMYMCPVVIHPVVIDSANCLLCVTPDQASELASTSRACKLFSAVRSYVEHIRSLTEHRYHLQHVLIHACAATGPNASHFQCVDISAS